MPRVVSAIDDKRRKRLTHYISKQYTRFNCRSGREGIPERETWRRHGPPWKRDRILYEQNNRGGQTIEL